MSILQNYTEVVPSLNLNFAGARKLDQRINFARGSVGTYLDKNGLIKTAGVNEPRFDHLYNGTNIESLGLLIEESRTNLLLRSQTLATSPWTILNAGGSSITNNTFFNAPNGALASTFTIGTAADSIYQDVSVSGTGTYTFSIFVHPGTSTQINITGFFISNTIQNIGNCKFNPTTGQIVLGTGKVESYPDGWYKVSVTGTGNNASNNTFRAQIYGEVTGTVYLWGAQLEAGAFATSYIPTVASQVTRTADNASITGTNFSNWFNNTEGTIFSQALVPLNRTYSGTFRSIAQFIKTSTYNSDSIFPYINSSNQTALEVRSSSTTVANISQAQQYSLNDKIAISYALDDYAISSKGLTPATDTSGALPTGIDKLCIGNVGDNNASGCINGTISNITYYPKRLTNTQLQNLTK